MVAEFAFGGYYKGSSRGGPSPIDLMELTTPASVLGSPFQLWLIATGH